MASYNIYFQRYHDFEIGNIPFKFVSVVISILNVLHVSSLLNIVYVTNFTMNSQTIFLKHCPYS